MKKILLSILFVCMSFIVYGQDFYSKYKNEEQLDASEQRKLEFELTSGVSALEEIKIKAKSKKLRFQRVSERYKGKKLYFVLKGNETPGAYYNAEGLFPLSPKVPLNPVFSNSLLILQDSTIIINPSAFAYYCRDVLSSSVLILQDGGKKEYKICGISHWISHGEVDLTIATDMGNLYKKIPTTALTDVMLEEIIAEVQTQYSSMLHEEKVKKEKKEQEIKRRKEREEEEARIQAELQSKISDGPLKIVGVNAEKSFAKNDFYSKPIILHDYMKPVDPYTNEWWGEYPANQTLFYSGKSNWKDWSYRPWFLKLEDGVAHVIQPRMGYYTIMGVLICKEECEPITTANISFDSCPSIDQNNRLRIRARIERASRVPSYKKLKDLILEKEKVTIEPAFYILRGPDGNTYYTCQDNGALKLDFYKIIESELKGQHLCFKQDGVIGDYYTDIKLKVQGYNINMFIEDFDKNIYENVLFCKDIVLDCSEEKNVVLAVLENNDKTSVISYPLIDFNDMGGYIHRFKKYELDYDYLGYDIEESDSGSILVFDKDGGIISEPSIRRLIEEKENFEMSEQKRQEQAEVQRKKNENKHKNEILRKYGEEFGQKILEHKLSLGMTPEMCKASIGFPNRIYESTSNSGEFLTYYYAYMAVYFTDGKLVRVDSLINLVE